MRFSVLARIAFIAYLCQISHVAIATTYTCTKVQDEAVLAYNGSDGVTENHTDGKCSWSIGDACEGCTYDRSYYEQRSIVLTSLRNSGIWGRELSISYLFPGFVEAARERLDIDFSDREFSNFNMSDIPCYPYNNRDNEFKFEQVNSEIEISCSLHYVAGGSIRVNNETMIEPSSDLVILSMRKRWGNTDDSI